MNANFTIAGIAPSVQEATLRPKPTVAMSKIQLSTSTAGKLFFALTDFDPNTPNVIGMLFNGKPVKIRKNEKYMGTNTADQTEGRFKAYAFDVPMRFLNPPFPADYTIQFVLGHMEGETFIEEAKSTTFTLTIMGE